jgi:hypothetical protein
MGMLGSAALIIASLQFVAFPIRADSDMIPLCAPGIVNIDVGRQRAPILLFICVCVDGLRDREKPHTHLSFSLSGRMHC